MSSTFASNVGTDKTLVFSGSNVVWSDSGCASGPPCPFDINITFTTPFNFADTGPILVDMLETNVTGTSGAFDAVSAGSPGGSVAQVLGTLGGATGTFAYQGNIVQLTYNVVPGYPTFSGIVNAGNQLPPRPAQFRHSPGGSF